MIVDSKIREKIRKYIIVATLADPEEIKDDISLFEEGYFDSMGLLFLIEFINDEFHVDTKDDELVEANFKSINSIVAFISHNLKLEKIKDAVQCHN